jgi:hypothetical protein
MACVDRVREQDAFIAIARKFMDIMKSDNAKPINIIDAEVVFVATKKDSQQMLRVFINLTKEGYFVLATPKLKSLDIEAPISRASLKALARHPARCELRAPLCPGRRLVSRESCR